jgi:hypothetical protein
MIDSTSDERVVNNVVRHEYRVLTDAEKNQMKMLKDQGLALIALCQSIGASREMSLAVTKVEEAIMWFILGWAVFGFAVQGPGVR